MYIRFWPTQYMCASEQRKRSCAYIYIIYGSGQPKTCAMWITCGCRAYRGSQG